MQPPVARPAGPVRWVLAAPAAVGLKGVRWKLVLEYDGTAFSGWQHQPGQRTIQDVVERAIALICEHEARVTVAGRTDAGVHAEAQVCSFQTHVDRDERAIREGLNHHLPDDVAVVSATLVEDRFDARHWSWGKHYRYSYFTRTSRSPLRAARSWHVRNLDVAKMVDGARHLVGRHDFSSFRAQGCAAGHAVRTVESVDVVRHGDLVHLDVRGQGFLRHMVRIFAGTLADVGRGRTAPDAVAGMLEAKDRTMAGKTAPAHGLTLLEVRYGDGPPPWIVLDDDED
jgi:tRNA pseudouridine38-40 synthase